MDTHRLVTAERTTIYDEELHTVLPVTFKVSLWRGADVPQAADWEVARQNAEALGLAEAPITPEERRIVKLGRLGLSVGLPFCWEASEKSPDVGVSLAH